MRSATAAWEAKETRSPRVRLDHVPPLEVEGEHPDERVGGEHGHAGEDQQVVRTRPREDPHARIGRHIVNDERLPVGRDPAAAASPEGEALRESLRRDGRVGGPGTSAQPARFGIRP